MLLHMLCNVLVKRNKTALEDHPKVFHKGFIWAFCTPRVQLQIILGVGGEEHQVFFKFKSLILFRPLNKVGGFKLPDVGAPTKKESCL